jgi:hypothetical protein
MTWLMAGRSGLVAVIALVSLPAFERASYAKKSSVDTTPLSLQGQSQPVVQNQGPASAGSVEVQAARFIECHISHHPLQGVPLRVCPLLVAEAQDHARPDGPEAATSAAVQKD